MRLTSDIDHLLPDTIVLLPVIDPDPLWPSPLLSSVEEQPFHSFGSIVVASVHEDAGSAVAVDPSMNDELPPDELVLAIDMP
jgi:hypothetical protein